jgi:hypothetical protein
MTLARHRERPLARSTLVCTVLVLGGALGIARVQPRLFADVQVVKQRDDVFLLPPPRQLRAMTMGYCAAATDLLWAKLVLENGLHFTEKRPFPDLPRYVDGILALEPDFPTVYQYVDTMILYAPQGNTPENARLVRSYLERGTRERPFDQQMWQQYGQFIAFFAPAFLTDKQEIETWRREGARALARAVELGADPDRSLAASTILGKEGEKKAAIEHLQRAYALSDNPETRRQISFKLRKLEATAESELAVDVVEREWRAHFPFLSKGEALLVGPSRDAAACAGPASFDRKRCARDWTTFIDERR